MTWHPEVLDNKLLAAVDALAGVLGKDFYLAGGTALALHLGHRRSVDLDLFSWVDALDRDRRDRIVSELQGRGTLRVQEQKDRALHITLDGLPVSLLHFSWPLIRPADRFRGLRVASMEDLAAMKLNAVIGRGTRRDFIDTYVLSQEMGLDAVLESGKQRFPQHTDFDLQAARALCFFDDAEKDPVPLMLRDLDWQHVRSYFEEHIPTWLRAHLTPLDT